MPTEVTPCQLDGRYIAYVADGSSGIQIINVNDPSAPTAYRCTRHAWLGYSWGVTLSPDGHTAYVTDGTAQVFR